MKSLRIAACLLGFSIAAFSQSSTLTLTGTTSITNSSSGTSSFTMSGTATLLGLGNAVFSGAGTVPTTVLSGQVGPVNGNFAMIFPDGALLFGSFTFPAIFLVPSLGGSAAVTGTLTITGGTGRFENARGTFTPLSGTGTATSSTSATFTIQGNGTLNYGIKILPQLAFGGGWYTALYFTNSTSQPVSFTVSFTSNSGAPLNIANAGGTTTTVNIPAGGSARIEAPNVGTLTEGWATANLPPGVNGYGVFRQGGGTIADQEAVVPFSNTGVTSSSIIFDDTNYITAVSIVNPNDFPITVNATATNISGNALGAGTIQLAAKSKTAVTLKTITGLAGVAGNRGTISFTSSTGSFAVLGLRFFGSAFTSIPATER